MLEPQFARLRPLSSSASQHSFLPAGDPFSDRDPLAALANARKDWKPGRSPASSATSVDTASALKAETAAQTPRRSAPNTRDRSTTIGWRGHWLDHICNRPDRSVRDLCSGDLSRGPYLFTYALPASNMNSVPPPFLFVDLSNINAQAFRELLSAYKEQVKRNDITDQARIRTLRLAILNITLTAADWVNPIQKEIADIVHSSADDGKK